MADLFRGIVLRSVKYGESGLIVDLLTESRGRMSFMTSISHGRGRRGTGAAAWQPLSMVEFEANVHGQSRLPYPRNVRLYAAYADLPYNPPKTMLALFVAEFLSHALRDAQTDTLLYKYVESSLLWLDGARRGVGNFHLVFLMRLTRFMGIYPNLEGWMPRSFFDLQTAEFRRGQPPHPHFVGPDEARLLPLLFRMNYANMHLFRMTRQDRWRLLHGLVDFYRLHLPCFPELRSLDVLREVFD